MKMRNSASGVSNMVRVEVQNADIDIHSKKIAGRNNSTTGTILILLSDDKTGFVPYRIDNFSLEVNSSCYVAFLKLWFSSLRLFFFYSETADISAEM